MEVDGGCSDSVPSGHSGHATPRDSWKEPRSNLQIVFTHAELGGALERLSCDVRLATSSAELRATSEEVQDRPKTNAACLRFVNL